MYDGGILNEAEALEEGWGVGWEAEGNMEETVAAEKAVGNSY